MGDLRTWSDKHITYGSIYELLTAIHSSPAPGRLKQRCWHLGAYAQMDLLTYNDTQQYNIRPS